jgi:dihydrofolate synthase/folylpolyglutamate synthase
MPRPALSYSEAWRRLYSLEHWGIKLGLDNIREFCATLGNPQARFVSLHIAGTNGKGSTSAFLDAILRAAGYRVGRYTSPHLRDFRERIHIGGRPVPASWVAEFVAEHWALIVEKRYSYFEVSTALGFWAFARAGMDLGVIEVGLGGRFDATNVIDPALAVITRIARDHEHVLGHTPEAIAFEKAGIIKEGVPVVIGPLVEAADTRIREIAEERAAPLWTAAEILADRKASDCLPSARESWRVPLHGTHQYTNLSTALASVAVLRTHGLDIPARAIRAGIEQVAWPARFQIDRGRPTVVYDAAHNPDGLRTVAETWRRVFGRRRCVCVFNTRPDKNHAEMLEALAPIVGRWVFTPMPDSPYIAREELLSRAAGSERPAEWRPSPSDAMRCARSLAGASGAVLVTGSHYLVGAVIPSRLVAKPAGRATESTPVTRRQLLAASQDRGAPF